MRRALGSLLAAAALAACLAGPARAQSDGRTAEQVLKDLDAVTMPAIPENRQDPDAVRKYIAAATEARAKRSALTAELLEVAPDNERLVELLQERWMTTMPTSPEGEAVAKEIAQVLATTKNEKLKTEARFAQAVAALRKSRGNPEAAMEAVDAFLAADKADTRAGQLLYSIANMTEDVAKKTALEDRLLKEFPDSRYTAMIAGARKQREAVGKPFDLPEFQDVATGKTVSMDTLKGKVVVVDFWATWCGPCVAEMPNMKKLYAEYAPKGVEFVGVSLDQPEDEGGLDALKKFVADREIPWPQYYQGKGWESTFSSSWGINAIPAVFILDQDGNLHSTEARGKLEELIPALLEKKSGAAGQ